MLLEFLEEETPFTFSRIRAIQKTASKRYKKFSIQKKGGQKGNCRDIYQPSKELKFLQRVIVRKILQRFPIHDSATAYKRGASILNNAQLHVESKYLLRMDFKDFFPSITRDALKAFFVNGYQFLDNVQLNELDILCDFLCRHNALTIGAPSSPYLSNIIMNNFDIKVNTLISEKHIIYTRYADDLYFSTSEKNILQQIEDEIYQLTENPELSFLTINKNKTYNASKKHSRKVTGIVLTHDDKLSVGRERKRFIQKMLHKRKYNLLSADEIQSLDGYLAFIKNVEPDFFDKVKNKFNF